MAANPAPDERRRFRRILAPVQCRPPGKPWMPFADTILDIGLGGVRVQSDEYLARGARVQLELKVAQSSPIEVETEVVWVDRPGNGGAPFELGLRFLHFSGGVLQQLSPFLER